MKLVFEVDTDNPQAPEKIRAEAAYLIHLADNLASFIAQAPGNPESAFKGTPATPPAGMLPPPAAATATPAPAKPVPVPPAPTNNGDGSATDLLRAPAGEVELDKHGLPWDARINASTKNKNADGSWKALRGVDKMLVVSVVAELRKTYPLPGAQATAAPVPPPPAAAPAAPPVPPPPGAPVAAPAAPPVPPPPAAAPAIATPPGLDNVAMRSAIVDACGAGKITLADVTTECMNLGYGNMGEVFNAGQIGAIYAALKPRMG